MPRPRLTSQALHQNWSHARSILAGGDQNGGGLDGNQEMILRGSYDPDVDTMWSVSRYARGGAQGSPDMPALFGKVTGQD